MDNAQQDISPKCGDELITSVLGREPIALVLTGRFDASQGFEKWFSGYYNNLPFPAMLLAFGAMVAAWFWNPLGVVASGQHWSFRIATCIGAALCAFALLRLLGVRTRTVPIHDALVVGEDHVWFLIGCRQDRLMRVVTCDCVQKHKKDHVTVAVGKGVRAPLGGGHLVYIEVKVPGDRIKAATYRLQQGSTHSDRQFFSRGVVSVSEAEALLVAPPRLKTA